MTGPEKMHSSRLLRSLGSVAFLYLALAMPCSAQPQESILIRNATLIDRGGDHAGVVVNILIKDSKLDIITEDLIPIEQADVSYDASGGFVLGELKLGGSASFF